MDIKKSAIIGLPPGLGDLHFVLTKLESFKKKNNIDYLRVAVYEDKCHCNSKEFLEMVPFIDEVLSVKYSIPFDFLKPRDRRVHFKKNCNNLDYVIEFNTPLEAGVRIEQILPEYDIDFDYSLKLNEEDKKYAKEIRKRFGGKLVLLYSSSIPMNNAWAKNTWTVLDWVRLANCIKERIGSSSILIGKEWDQDYVNQIIQHDTKRVIHSIVDQTTIGQTLSLINESDLLIGFPSGLTILATKFHTPVVMFWPIKGITPDGEFDPGFQTSWVDKAVIQDGTYLPFVFGDSLTTPKRIFRAIERFL